MNALSIPLPRSIFLFLFFVCQIQIVVAQDFGFLNPTPSGISYESIAFFPDSDSFIAVDGTSCIVIKSDDLGSTLEIDCLDMDEDNDFGFDKVYFLDNGDIFVFAPFGEFLSSDGGSTWSSFTFPPSAQIEDIDFNDSGFGVAATRGLNDISFSNDGGLTWEGIDSEINAEFSSCAVTNDNTVYIGGKRGDLFVSNDGLQTVTKAADLDGWITDIHFFDNENGMYVSTGEIGYTSDGGMTWNIGLDIVKSSYESLAVNEAGDAIVSEGSILYHSSDQGQNWVELIDIDEYFDTPMMDFDFPESFAVAIHDSTILMGGNYGSLVKSTDLGVNWELVSEYVTTSNIRTLYQEGDNSVVVSTLDEVMLSNNTGTDWNIQEDSDYDFDFIDKLETDELIGISRNEEVFISNDFGVTWNEISEFSPNQNFNLNTAEIVPGGAIFVLGNDGLLFKSSDNGQNWEQILGSFLDTGDELVSIDFLDANNGLIGGNNNIIYKTIDGGVSWSEINVGTMVNPFGYEFLELSYPDEQTIYTYTIAGGLRSTDGGQTFEPFGEGFIYLITIDQNGKGARLYDSRVYTTENFGQTWRLVSEKISTGYNDIFKFGDHLWLTGLDGLIWHGTELFTSTDEHRTDEDINSISVYPNPMSHSLMIQDSDSSNLLYDIKVFNSYGGIMMSKNSVPKGINIDVQSLPSGIYFVQILSNGFVLKMQSIYVL